MSEFIEKLKKTREYLDYLERHYNNVQKAWKIVQLALHNEPVVYDDFRYFSTLDELKEHDLSKFSATEFTAYRVKFFPTELEKTCDVETNERNVENFSLAWAHHKASNDHHHETWIKREHCHPYYKEWACAQMICDWVAMSLEFGEKSPREYYAKNMEKIMLPTFAEKDLFTVCDYMESKKYA